MTELTGSEKQIKWASDIRNGFFNNMETLLSNLETRKNELTGERKQRRLRKPRRHPQQSEIIC